MLEKGLQYFYLSFITSEVFHESPGRNKVILSRPVDNTNASMHTSLKRSLSY